MDDSWRNRIEHVAARLVAWLESWQPEGGLYCEDQGWEAISAPWYSGSVADNVAAHLIHTAGNCRHVLDLLQHLAQDAFPADDDDSFDTLFNLSPFTGGPVVEIKYMMYRFGPLYHNVMNAFLKYMNDSDACAATKAGIFSIETPRSVPDDLAIPPSVDALARHLGGYGTLSPAELYALAGRLVDIWKAIAGFFGEIERCEQYSDEVVWVGLVALQARLQEVLAAIVRVEPLWAVYEHSPYRERREK